MAGQRGLVDGRPDRVELRGGTGAEEADGDDADDRDQGDEEGVLHEGGATVVVTEAGLETSAEEVECGEHGAAGPFVGCPVRLRLVTRKTSGRPANQYIGRTTHSG